MLHLMHHLPLSDGAEVLGHLVRTCKLVLFHFVFKDFLDLMLKAASDESLSESKRMSEAEVLAQSMVFLLAGYETSSNTLGLVCYHLATDPDVQEKLQKEIDSVWDDESQMPSYETVNELPYLDMAICETLRLYPPGERNIFT